jgi:hypothetical protein
VDAFHPPVPVRSLQYFPVVNYAGKAIAQDLVLVDPGERLVVLGKNPSLLNGGSISLSNAYRTSDPQAAIAQGLLTDELVGSGFPVVVLDEGTYVFAEYGGAEDPTPRQVHEGALVGYRVRRDQ